LIAQHSRDQSAGYRDGLVKTNSMNAIFGAFRYRTVTEGWFLRALIRWEATRNVLGRKIGGDGSARTGLEAYRFRLCHAEAQPPPSPISIINQWVSLNVSGASLLQPHIVVRSRLRTGNGYCRGPARQRYVDSDREPVTTIVASMRFVEWRSLSHNISTQPTSGPMKRPPSLNNSPGAVRNELLRLPQAGAGESRPLTEDIQNATQFVLNYKHPLNWQCSDFQL
jgi:hypothetical protein